MQNKNWIKIHQKLPGIKWIDENICEVENIRNCKYDIENINTEFEPENIVWETERYDLRNLKDVWFIENNYAKMQSHIMLSFEFEDDRFLTVSAEVRKEGGKDFEVWHVLYKTFNIFYIFSKEEDIVFLRTNIRKSGIYIYKLNIEKNEMVNLFKEISISANKIQAGENIVYKLFKTDCVNTLLTNFTNAKIKVKKYFWDYSPTTVLWRSGLIKNDISENGEKRFKNLKDLFKKTFVYPENENIKKSKQDKNYSKEIREIKYNL